MNYYSFNVGDYRRDTLHLTRLEHSIYRELIDWYYLDEAPIPQETQMVARKMRLGSEDEIEALNRVLEEFFEGSEKGWIHHRIEADIESYRHRCARNQINGKSGGRPKKTQSVSDLSTGDNPLGSQKKATGNPTNNHKPITNNQEQLPGFAEFWAAYPKKVAKPDAMKAWKQQKINGEQQDVLAAIVKLKGSEQWKKNGGAFIPNPATFLRQRRWEDEVSTGHTAHTNFAAADHGRNENDNGKF